MNPAFLVLANLCLCTRLFCLLRDDVADARIWRLKAMVEVVIATILFPLGSLWFAVILTLAGFNYAGFRAERRSRRKDYARLLLGAFELAILSIWLSPRLGLGFRPELAVWATSLGQWTALASFLDLLGSGRFQLVLFGLLLAANESN